jgi:cold shock CspA family protein
MTTGTVHTFNPRRGRGLVRSTGGSLVPFSTREPIAAGDRVRFSVCGGMAGVYARGVRAA